MKSNTPFFSLVIPAYNSESTLTNCLDSILAQTFNDFEVIVIDDGSKDSTHQIAKNFRQKDSRLKVFSIKNGGVANARNTGIDKSSGRFICFIDSDDTIESNYLKSIKTEATASQPGIIITDVNIVGTRTQNLFKPFKPTHLSSSPTPLVYELVANKQLLSPWGKAYRLDVIKKEKIYFPKHYTVGEDMVFNLDFLLHNDYISSVPSGGYNYILSQSDSLTSKATPKTIKTYKDLLNIGLKFCESKNLPQNTRRAFYLNYLKSIYFGLSVTNPDDNDNLFDLILRDSITSQAAWACLGRGIEGTMYSLPIVAKQRWWVELTVHSRSLLKHTIRGRK